MHVGRDAQRQDGVDLILEQWSRERPDLDVSPMGVIGRISRLSRIFERGLVETFSSFGLGGGEFDVLATLRRAGEPYRLTPTELSKSLMVSSGGMTNRLDRLERAGFITRLPDPSDRRGTLVCLTDEGRRLVDEVVAAHVENEHHLLDSLAPSERKTLADLLRKLLLSLEKDYAP